MKQDIFEGEITSMFHTVIGTKYALEYFLGVSFFHKGMESYKEKL